MKEFWTDIVTRASWQKLTQLSREISFVLIGGWAVFLHTGKHKSKDIDIIVDHETLSYLKTNYDLTKNPSLKKYEIKQDKFDIDIYTPFFSNLKIPAQDILENYNTRVKAINVITPEALLVLKQAALEQRSGTPKGMKDEIDITTLFLYAGIDWKKYADILKKHGLQDYAPALASLVKNYDEKQLDYLGVSFKQFKNWQKQTLAAISKNT